MKILALDLGKNKSVFVDYVIGGERIFGKISTNPRELRNLLERSAPDRLVIEAGPAAGWVCDLAESMKVPVQVANANDERWRWKAVKEKSDRKDALKRATLSEMDSLPTVHVPRASVRQWRSLIEYRHALVQRRTAIKNSIRSIYERQGVGLPSAKRAWSQAAVEELKKEASHYSSQRLWLFQVHCELQQFESIQRQIEEVEEKLEERAKADVRVEQLKTAPCVGPRLGETVVAILDDPHRFRNGRQVGCYAGLTPRALAERRKRPPGSHQSRGQRPAASNAGGDRLAGSPPQDVDGRSLRTGASRQRQTKKDRHRGGGPQTPGEAVGDAARRDRVERTGPCPAAGGDELNIMGIGK